MPSLDYLGEIEFEVRCQCGASLDCDVKKVRYGQEIVVEPCQRCIEKAVDKATEDEDR